jgi:putative flippase GtrA
VISELVRHNTFIRFILSGGIVYFTDLLGFMLLNYYFPSYYQAANVLGRVFGAFTGFILHKTFTFNDRNFSKIKRQFIYYILVLSGNICLSIVLLKLLFEDLSFNLYIARILVDIIVVLVTYLFSKHLIFK